MLFTHPISSCGCTIICCRSLDPISMLSEVSRSIPKYHKMSEAFCSPLRSATSCATFLDGFHWKASLDGARQASSRSDLGSLFCCFSDPGIILKNPRSRQVNGFSAGPVPPASKCYAKKMKCLKIWHYSGAGSSVRTRVVSLLTTEERVD